MQMHRKWQDVRRRSKKKLPVFVKQALKEAATKKRRKACGESPGSRGFCSTVCWQSICMGRNKPHERCRLLWIRDVCICKLLAMSYREWQQLSTVHPVKKDLSQMEVGDLVFLWQWNFSCGSVYWRWQSRTCAELQ